jgi:16S rRNA C967 or C1407 C5-methylase (RsmB/RsmF family)
MDHPEWMNEQVKGEIEDLRRRFGFEEREAVAAWHLRRAAELLAVLRTADVEEGLRRDEKETFPLEEAYPLVSSEMAAAQSIPQHFSALYRELGVRVLQRTFSEGWGGTTPTDEEEEG